MLMNARIDKDLEYDAQWKMEPAAPAEEKLISCATYCEQLLKISILFILEAKVRRHQSKLYRHDLKGSQGEQEQNLMKKRES